MNYQKNKYILYSESKTSIKLRLLRNKMPKDLPKFKNRWKTSKSKSNKHHNNRILIINNNSKIKIQRFQLNNRIKDLKIIITRNLKTTTKCRCRCKCKCKCLDITSSKITTEIKTKIRTIKTISSNKKIQNNNSIFTNKKIN